MYNQKQTVGFGIKIEQKRQYNEARIMRNYFNIECFDKNGKLKWEDFFANLVVDEGLDDSLDKHLKGSGYTAAFFVGLTDAATVTVDPTDTMSSHVGWVEEQSYSEGVRQTLILGTVLGESVDNVASVAAFSINGTTIIGGAFITTNNTKGGSTGILYGAGAFTGGDRAVILGDTVNVTVTLTAAAS